MLIIKMNNKNKLLNLNDTAYLAYQPLINFEFDKTSNLTSQAVTYWLKQTEFDAWGPSMLPVSSFRFLLNQGGLPIHWGSFFAFPYHHSAISSLLTLWQNKTLSSDQSIYLARFLLYLGFHQDSKNILLALSDSIQDSPEHAVWCQYLLAQIHRTSTIGHWSIQKLEASLAEYSASISPRLNFNASLMIAIYWTTLGLSKTDATKWLEQAEAIISTNAHFKRNLFDRRLAESRLARYQAVHFFNQKKTKKYQSVIDETLISLGIMQECSSVRHSSAKRFLVDEAKRRLLEYHVLNLFARDRYKQAIPYALEATQIDPHCPKALMLTGYAFYKTGQPKEAIIHLRQSILKGVLERAYCQHLLLEMSPIHRNFIAERREVEDSNLFSFQLHSNQSKNIQLSPAFLENYQMFLQQTDSKPIDIQKHLKSKIIYQQYLPFWELCRHPTEMGPVLVEAPLAAWEAWTQNKEPFYHTLYIQRIMMPGFREELWHASVGNMKLAQDSITESRNPRMLSGLSDHCDKLLNALENKDRLSKLELSLVARVLGNLGFIQEALQMSQFDETKNHWNVEESYLANTHLFYKFILEGNHSSNFDQLLIQALMKTPKTPLTLRARFSFCIIACIYYGQAKNPDKLPDWREATQKVIDDILASVEFSDFEKNLLYSRFYRAVCYLPYLIHDHKKLIYEAEICEQLARNLNPKNSFESILKRDNLYSMLDTLHRVYLKLDDKERAEKMLLEILDKIDPSDSKALNQLGELYENQGKFDKAISCFCKATEFGAPQGRVAAFRAGYLLERSGQDYSALEYYFKSLQFWPNGLSPLQGILRLANKTKNHYLKTWAKTEYKKYER
jgi:tetratricopeptide (TPR) repeat protein